ncbi:hypothetical protein ABIF66_002385 [Bradyrhizobium japonicum]
MLRSTFLSIPGHALDQCGADCLKEPNLITDRLGFIARRGQGERLRERHHSIGIASMGALLAVLTRLLGGVGLLERQHPVQGTGHDCKPRLGCGGRAQRRPVVEPTLDVRSKHGADDFVLLHEHADRLGLVDPDLFGAVSGILPQCALQVLRDADVVHHQPRRLIAEAQSPQPGLSRRAENAR